MKNQILLDSQSTVDLFCNPALMDGIVPSKTALTLATNAGVMETNKEGNVNQQAGIPVNDKVWFDKDTITNVFGLANMVKRHRVTIDSTKENAFIVHTPEGPIRFGITADNLYAYCPDLNDLQVDDYDSDSDDEYEHYPYDAERGEDEIPPLLERKRRSCSDQG